MCDVKQLKALASLALAACLLSSCGLERALNAPRAERVPGLDGETEPQPTPTAQAWEAGREEPVPEEEQNVSFSTYLGKTVGEAERDLGSYYSVDVYEGSTLIRYDLMGVCFLFGAVVDSVTDDLVIRQMFVTKRQPVLYTLMGAMTYPEIRKAVFGRAEVPAPENYFNYMSSEWEYSTSFSYRGYEVTYTWRDDPERTPSESVYVTKSDVELTPPSVPAVPAGPPENTGRIDEPFASQGLFCGPGWFEGVMGSAFYVPEGFVQQGNEGPAAGSEMHTYRFRNNALGMEISVFECTLLALPIDVAQEYAAASSADGVTYATSGNGYYVVSGYSDSETIYYTRVDYNESFYYNLDYRYPAANADACEEILLAFLSDYSAG